MNDDKATKRAFKAEMLMLGEVFGGSKQITPTLARAYFLTLREFDFEAVRDALHRALREWKPYSQQKLPPPALLREWIEGSPDERAQIAWSRTRRLAALVDAYRAVDLEDPVAHAAIELVGGWAEIHRLESAQDVQVNVVRGEFMRCYRIACHRRDLVARAPSALAYSPRHDDDRPPVTLAEAENFTTRPALMQAPLSLVDFTPETRTLIEETRSRLALVPKRPQLTLVGRHGSRK